MRPGFSVEVSAEPEFPRSSLVVGWRGDAGDLGEKVTDYLGAKLEGQEFAEIDPEGFFPLGGVSVEDDVARFPESRLWVCPERELLLFQSDPPRADWYRFLNSVLDLAEQRCRIEEVHIVGALVSLSAHTTPRQLFAVFASAQARDMMTGYDLVSDMDYRTTPGERPTLNSLLLWLVGTRSLSGVSLWVPTPHYLATTEDAQAQGKVLRFLDERLHLRLDFSTLNAKILKQNERLARVRSLFPKMDEYISRLESNLTLSDEENGELIRTIEDSVKEAR